MTSVHYERQPPPDAGKNSIQRWMAKSQAAIGQFAAKAVARLLFHPPQPNDSPTRILVLRTGYIGDIACTMPAFNHLRQKYPAATIALISPIRTANPGAVTVQSGAYLLQGAGLIDAAWTLPIVPGNWKQSISDARTIIDDYNPDKTYILPQTAESWRQLAGKLLFLSRAGLKARPEGIIIGPQLRPFGDAVAASSSFPHQTITALTAVGAPAKSPSNSDSCHFPISSAASSKIDQLCKELGLSRGRFVTVFIGSKMEHKRWPTHKYLELCQRIENTFGPELRITFIGGPDDQSASLELKGKLSNTAVSFAGELDLLETIELLRRSALYIGNDSGPAHLAALAGIPTVVIFASHMFPGIWEPWSSKTIALRTWVDCSHCLSETHCPLGTSSCIEQLSVEFVWRHVADQIQAVQ